MKHAFIPASRIYFWAVATHKSRDGLTMFRKYLSHSDGDCRYRQTANISHTLVENKIVDHSNYIFILDLTLGFKVLGKENCKTRRETSKFRDLVLLISGVWRWMLR